LSYLTWRRRKGPQMFMKYAGMTMEKRDPFVAEWANTITIVDAPNAAAQEMFVYSAHMHPVSERVAM
jgi:hypothetical protein